MSFWPNPKRLSEPGSDAPEALREALKQARVPEVANGQARRVAEKLFPLLAAGAAAPLVTEGVGTVWPAFKLSALAKTLGVAAGAGLALTAAFFAYPGNQPAPPKQSITRAIPAVSARPATRPEAEKPEPPAAAEDDLGIELPMALPEITITGPAIRRAHDRGAARKAPAKLDPAAELALLKSAQLMLEKRPKLTLALVGEHERMYAKGIFAQEREILAIEALLKIGARAEARERGERFLSSYPESAHVRRIHNLIKQYPAPR